MNNAIRNTNELEFAIFCIESIAAKLNIDAAAVYSALTEKSDILNAYVIPCYGSLHTQSKNYITDDILDAARKEGVEL